MKLFYNLFVFILILFATISEAKPVDNSSIVDFNQLFYKNYTKKENKVQEFYSGKISMDVYEAEKIFSTCNNLKIENFAIGNGDKYTLSVSKKYSVIDQNTKFVSENTAGEYETQSPELITFQGSIEGQENSKVYMIMIDKQLYSIISLNDINYILSPDIESGKKSDYILLPESELYRNNSFNPSALADDIGGILSDHKYSNKPFVQSDKMLELELALETDTEFFKKTGGTLEKAQNYAIAMVSLVSMIYEEYINVTFHLTWLKCWTDSPADPYDAKGNPFDLSDRAREYWKANYKNVKRDLFHVMTADTTGQGQGGFGFFDALCTSGDYGYATSSIKAVYNMPTYAFTYDVYTLAHEIGHNFNASHTHSCAYNNIPLDTCLTIDAINAGCLDANEQPKPNLGSIMSYCGGINSQVWGEFKVRMIFLPQVESVMRQTAESAACLTEPENPVVYLLAPKGRQIYNASDTILIKWASNRVSQLNIYYTNNDGLQWDELALGIPATDKQFIWVTPERCLNNVKIRISDAINPEIADTSDFDFSIFKKDTSGLLGDYPFDGNANNMVCGFGTAEPVGSQILTDDRFGNVNSAFRFSGQNHFIIKDCELSSNEFTVSFWFNTTTNTGVQTIIGTNWEEASRFQIYLWWGTFGAAIWRYGDYAPVQIWSNPVSVNQWNHGVLTYDGKSLKIYLNGAITATLDSAGHFSTSLANIYIGSRRDVEKFNGKIDDIKYYNKCLNISRILEIFSEQKTVPDMIKILEPINNSIDNDLDLTFKWEENANAENYHLQLSLNNSFNESELIINDSNVAGSQFQIKNLLENSKYFWRIAGINKYGKGSWGLPKSFTTKATIGTEDNSNAVNHSFSIYPNPVQDNIIIKNNAINSSNVIIKIIDIFGNVKAADRKQFNSGESNSINISEFPSGVYFVIINDGLNTFSFKVVKE